MPCHGLRMSVYALFLVSVTGCCSLQPAPAPSPSTGASRETTEAFQAGDIIDTHTGKVISFPELMRALSDVKIIYVGEIHTSTEDHRIQQRVAAGLYAQNKALVLALEMFPKDVQPVLDRYTRGQLTEPEFLQEAHWQQVWGYPFALYRGIVNWARERHLRMIGLNIPPPIANKIARGGLASLTAAERSQVATHIDFGNSRHRRYLEEQFEHHPRAAIKDFQTFYEAQLAWEETMAQTLAQTLPTLPHSGQILVLIGMGHINHRFGVPQRAWQRTRQPYKIILPLPIHFPDHMINPATADYIWVTPQFRPFHHGGPGLIIRRLPADQGLQVAEVIPESPAAKAGIKKNDIIRAVNDVPVTTLADLHRAAAREQGLHRLRLQRGSQQVTVTLDLPDKGQADP